MLSLSFLEWATLQTGIMARNKKKLFVSKYTFRDLPLDERVVPLMNDGLGNVGPSDYCVKKVMDILNIIYPLHLQTLPLEDMKLPPWDEIVERHKKALEKQQKERIEKLKSYEKMLLKYGYLREENETSCEN